MIPPVRIHGRKWDVEEWSMFKEIRDERAFNGILNQIIENIQNGSLKAGDALPAERTMAEIMGSIQTGSQRSFESTGTAGNSQAGAGRRKLYYGGPGYLADRTLIHTF